MKVLAILTMIVTLGAAPVFATDFSGSSSGVFQNAQGAGGMVTAGQGTSSFSWGNGSAYGSPPSSLTYGGMAYSGNFEQGFKFGSLTYYNGTIASGSGADSVDLATTFTFTNPSGIAQTFDFTFQLINTPNVGTAADSADIVKLAQLFDPSSSFSYNGNQYFLQFTGFSATDSFGFSPDASEFHVLENAYGTADLFGKITTHPTNDPSTVPEPSTIVLLGAGLAGIGFLRKRAKK